MGIQDPEAFGRRCEAAAIPGARHRAPAGGCPGPGAGPCPTRPSTSGCALSPLTRRRSLPRGSAGGVRGQADSEEVPRAPLAPRDARHVPRHAEPRLDPRVHEARFRSPRARPLPAARATRPWAPRTPPARHLSDRPGVHATPGAPALEGAVAPFGLHLHAAFRASLPFDFGVRCCVLAHRRYSDALGWVLTGALNPRTSLDDESARSVAWVLARALRARCGASEKRGARTPSAGSVIGTWARTRRSESCATS